MIARACIRHHEPILIEVRLRDTRNLDIPTALECELFHVTTESRLGRWNLNRVYQTSFIFELTERHAWRQAIDDSRPAVFRRQALLQPCGRTIFWLQAVLQCRHWRVRPLAVDAGKRDRVKR